MALPALPDHAARDGDDVRRVHAAARALVDHQALGVDARRLGEWRHDECGCGRCEWRLQRAVLGARGSCAGRKAARVTVFEGYIVILTFECHAYFPPKLYTDDRPLRRRDITTGSNRADPFRQRVRAGASACPMQSILLLPRCSQ